MREASDGEERSESPLKKRQRENGEAQQQPWEEECSSDKPSFNVAIVGCGHGELDLLYETVEFMKTTRGVQIDLVICCGDFQAVRNATDLESLAVKPRYRRMNTFYKYYSGESVAPVLTLFVGGNHESSAYLRELYYGGWVAPNIYYMGAAGVYQFGGLRIGGVSGIYKPYDYRKGHFELAPPFRGFTENTMRSVYHVREYEVFKLLQVTPRAQPAGRPTLDVMVSHDWPRGIAFHGDKERLLRRKGFLRREVESNTLGSVGSETLLQALRPAFWFAAHMHVKFPAIVCHPPSVPPPVSATASVGGGVAGAGMGSPPPAKRGISALLPPPKHAVASTPPTTPSPCPSSTAAPSAAERTKFLALDKIRPGGDFLQVITMPRTGPLHLRYDAEWLAILRSTAHLLSFSPSPVQMPSPSSAGSLRHNFSPTLEELEWVRARAAEKGNPSLEVPRTFAPTVLPHRAAPGSSFAEFTPPADGVNPQHRAFLEFLQLPDPFHPPPLALDATANTEEIDLDFDEDDL